MSNARNLARLLPDSSGKIALPSQVSGVLANANGGTGSTTGAFGDGQTWQNVTGSRSGATTYTNSTGKPIAVSAFTNGDAYTGISVYVNGSIVMRDEAGYHPGYGARSPTFTIVPNGATYRIDCGPSFAAWWELR